MSEFDAFESAAGAEGEQDPAAEFLAREQDQLAALEDDNFSGQEVANGGAADAGGADFGGSTQAAEVSEGLFDTGSEALDSGFGATESTGYEAISQVDQQRQEPEKIRRWREEQKERLAIKDEESEKKKGEWREIAKKELEDWYRHRNEQLEKTKANNREAEAVFVKERDETKPGDEWEKIYRLCEFNAKQARNTKDISRMRSILLQLKQTPLVR